MLLCGAFVVAFFATLTLAHPALPHVGDRAIAAADPASPTPTPPLTIYPRVGSQHESHIVPKGPGLLLMGGGPTVDSAFIWMHDTIVGSHWVRGGDVIVIRATEDNAYSPYIMATAPFNSVRSIIIGPEATKADLEKAAAYVDRAQAVFFSGGDQAHYVRWKGSPLIEAVQRLYERGGVIGGTSAGLAILGEWVYDSVAADAANDAIVTTANAVANPSEPIISFTHNLLRFPPLRNTITDTHLIKRDRLGRLMVFLARLQSRTPKRILGVGINQGSAIVIDRNGIGTLKGEHANGTALLVQLSRKTPVRPGKPFAAENIRITLLDRQGQQIDFNTWCARAPTYVVSVDGAKAPYYRPADPYKAPANATIATCR